MTEKQIEALKKATDATLTKAYRTLRDEKRALEQEHKAKLAPIEARMDAVSRELLTRFDERGLETVKTKHGSAYIYSQVTASIVDDDKFGQFVLANGRVDLYQRRVVVSAVREWNHDNPDNPVPGVALKALRSVRVRDI